MYRQASLDALALFSAATLCYYLAVLAVRDERDLRVLLTMLAASLVIVCWIGFIQKAGGLARTAAWAEQYRPESLQEGVLRKIHDPRGVRIFSSLVYPPALAGFLALTLGPCLVAVWLWREKFTRGAQITLATIMVVAVGLCLVWTRSKGGLLAFALAGVTTLLFLPISRKQRFYIAISTIAVAVVVLMIGYGVSDFRYAVSTGGKRIGYWQAAAKIFADHPAVGTGPLTFGSIHSAYKTPTSEFARLAHNNYVQMASDSGVLGFASFTALWTVGLFGALWRFSKKANWRITAGLGAGLLGWMWHNAMDFDLYIAGIALPAFILLGAVEGFNTPLVVSQPERASCRIVRIAMAIVCLLAIWPLVTRARAAYEFTGAGDHLGQRPNLYAAIATVERATKLQPTDAVYWDLLGRLRAQLGEYDAAFAASKQAIALDSNRANYHWHLGLQYYEADNHSLSDRAHKTLLHALQLAPHQASYHWQLGLLYAKADGKPSDRAIAEFETAKRLEPNNAEYQKIPERV